MISAIYARVSTDDQAEHGFSLGDQVRSCRERLTAMRLTNIKEYIDDGYSGEFLERPALDRLRQDLQNREVSHVMVYDPDRLSRNLTNQLILADDIERAGANLLFITGDYDCSPEGKLFFSMRGAISAFEKAKIRERSMRGKRAKVMSGRPVLPPVAPYGYLCDREAGIYIINQEEAEVVREIFKRYIENKYGITALAISLDADGYKNRAGRRFSSAVLHNMLCNEMYAGTKWAFTTYQKTVAQKKTKVYHRDKSEWIALDVPAIIDRETWQESVITRKQNTVLAKRNHVNAYLLSSFIRCPDCGYVMSGVTFPKKNNKDYRYYVCTAPKNDTFCPNRKVVPSVELDEIVWDELVRNYTKDKFITNERKRKKDNCPALQDKIVKLKKRQATILKLVSGGSVGMDIAEKELNSLTAQINEATELINKPVIEGPLNLVTAEQILNAKTYDEKRRIIHRLNITIYAKKENGQTLYSIKPNPLS